MRIAADYFFFFQAEDGIRDRTVTGVQTCALPILGRRGSTTTELTRRLVRPVLKSLQLSPPSVLLKTPPPWVPAYRVVRSEERRVGKECRSRWSADQEEKEEIVRSDRVTGKRVTRR